MNIYLVGPMGSGKSFVGTRLAERLDLRFIDTDVMIEEKANSSIVDIFNYQGEEAFRDIEKSVIYDVSQNIDNTVVATGGGAVAFGDNMKLMKESGLTITLIAELNELLSRTKNDTSRPLLAGGFVEHKLFQMLMGRMYFYTNTDILIDTTNKDYNIIIDEIVMELENEEIKNRVK